MRIHSRPLEFAGRTHSNRKFSISISNKENLERKLWKEILVRVRKFPKIEKWDEKGIDSQLSWLRKPSIVQRYFSWLRSFPDLPTKHDFATFFLTSQLSSARNLVDKVTKNIQNIRWKMTSQLLVAKVWLSNISQIGVSCEVRNMVAKEGKLRTPDI